MFPFRFLGGRRRRSWHNRNVPTAVINNPILNSPFAEPTRHWVLDENGIPTGLPAEGRRRSEFVAPVPPPKHRVKDQGSLDLEDNFGQRKPNDYINEIRSKVAAWRALGSAGLRATVTPVTARPLQHWRDPARQRRLFFCQIEAAETAIWLTEVAPKQELERLRALSAEANPDLLRIAFKLATGAGKTTVMAMLIAWQTLNAARSRNSPRFTDAFLVVTPGLTVRDRLRVLLPADPNSVYAQHDIVPREMRDDLQRARIVISNYHAFQRRETMEAPKLAKAILGGREGPVQTLETEGQMIQRVCAPLLGRRRILVLNDEAHHCYREKPDGEAKLDAEAKAEARRNNAAARLWISGIEALQRVVKHPVTVYDLSATPFFLRGSGYPEGMLFPWVVSDFSLIDAIECGIVKVPRVPVQDLAGADEPIYRHVYKHIRDRLPKAGRSKQAKALDPEDLPSQLVGALQALYGHYAKVFANWQAKGGQTPPVFIVVCNNTATSKLVYDWIAGYERTEKTPDGAEHTILVPGKLPLLSNVEDAGPGQRRLADRPRTILIDSEELESGEALSDSFHRLAASEIEAFKRELRARGRHAEAESLSDSDLLREVMNTVGQPGRLGEQIRCVVSVSMLTEGWDARTVTHVLGVRAFGTQLLCEQVIGRALRRVSYDPVGEDAQGNPMFEPEYADVLGIPFSFVPANSAADYRPPKPTTRVHAVLPKREALEIRFPRVLGYRVVLPPGRLTARFTAESRLAITPEMAPPDAINAPFVGENIRLSLAELAATRPAAIAFHLAGYTLERWFKDQEGNRKPWLFPSLLAITRRWMEECLTCQGGTFPAYLLWRDVGDKAAERIYRACVEQEGSGATLRPILDPYNETGSTRHVSFTTTKANLWQTDPAKCQINFVLCDSDWEAACAQALEAMPEVLRYAKNDRLGFEIPYEHGGEEHLYRPDFIAVIEDGGEGPLHLVLEVKGARDAADDAKHDTMSRLWVPAVNASARFGRWDFLRLDGPHDVAEAIRAHLARRPKAPAPFALTA
jgi:type III restriction enzyme